MAEYHLQCQAIRQVPNLARIAIRKRFPRTLPAEAGSESNKQHPEKRKKEGEGYGTIKM